MAKQKSVGAPLNNKFPESPMITKSSRIIYTGSANSQDTWHMRQGVVVNRSVKK